MKVNELIRMLQEAQSKCEQPLDVIFEVGDDTVSSHKTRVSAVPRFSACYVDLGCEIRTEVVE